jgi:N-acetyl sugar amidotransferase
MSKNRLCARCVMDFSAVDIHFDGNGYCNFCTDFLDSIKKQRLGGEDHQREKLLESIRRNGKGREYDCIVGISGGVDSSYVLFQAVRNGLRPLAVHLDNGWNSELAVDNIASLVRTLKVDLYTHVINWEENRDLQKSFFMANVLDIELLMDNAMLALNYEMARRYGLRHILAGTNRATEGMRMPQGWNWLKFDRRNILNIHQKYGSVPLRTHPLISVFDFVRYEFIHKIHWTPFLDFFNFKKTEALAELGREVGYRPYPYKHYESVFTRFYQGYILPNKFGIDKRRLHLSTLVVTGQMSRSDALSLLESSPYPDVMQMLQDREFVIKKLGFTEETFESYISTPEISHESYGTEKSRWDFLKRVHQLLGLKKR